MQLGVHIQRTLKRVRWGLRCSLMNSLLNPNVVVCGGNLFRERRLFTILSVGGIQNDVVLTFRIPGMR